MEGPCSPTHSLGAPCSEPEVEVLRDDHTLTGQVASNVRFPSNGTWCMCTSSFLGLEQVVVLPAPSSDFHFGGAAWFWAHAKCTVLVAEPVCLCVGGTIGCVASFECGSTVLLAESAYFCCGGAARVHAHSLCTPTVLGAKSACLCFGGAAGMPAHSLGTPAVLVAESTCDCFGGAA
jgi:hypothetical protein